MTWFLPRKKPEAAPLERALEDAGDPENAERVRPLSPDRLLRVVAEVTETEPSSDTDGSVTVRWRGLGFRFCLSPAANWLGVSSVWDPPKTVSDLPPGGAVSALQEAANEWNRLYLQPTAYPARFGQAWKLVFHYSHFVGSGVTDAQITAAARRCGDVNFQARDTIVSLLPPI